jgi:hypothetical protein
MHRICHSIFLEEVRRAGLFRRSVLKNPNIARRRLIAGLPKVRKKDLPEAMPLPGDYTEQFLGGFADPVRQVRVREFQSQALRIR